MRTTLIAVPLLAFAAPAAFAHPERHAYVPDGSVGAMDSAKRIRRSFRHQPRRRATRLRQLRRCRFHNLQAAVNHARSGAIIRIMPGVYGKTLSRAGRPSRTPSAPAATTRSAARCSRPASPATEGSPRSRTSSTSTKTASQATCSTWDPFNNPDPPGCDWFTRPKEPKQ